MRSAMTTQRMRFRKVCLVKFTRDESGSMTPFTMMMFFLMLLIGGLAVDVMRHERTRVRLQQTLDNSVLAAAARSQTLDPEHVVEDYFEKAGLSEYLMSVTVEQGLNFRSVFADAKAAGCIALGIEVDEEGSALRGRETGGHVDRAGGLAHPTLLIRECQNLHETSSLKIPRIQKLYI